MDPLKPNIEFPFYKDGICVVETPFTFVYSKQVFDSEIIGRMLDLVSDTGEQVEMVQSALA